MKITLYNKASTKSFSITPSQHFEKKEICVWVAREDGEGGQFDAEEIANVIYEALDKYFIENY